MGFFNFTFLDIWPINYNFDLIGLTKDHNWVITKPYQTKSSLLRPYFRCFWPNFWPNLIFFPFSQVLPPHPTTTLVWGIQEHLSHQWKFFFCLVMLQDQCDHRAVDIIWVLLLYCNCIWRCWLRLDWATPGTILFLTKNKRLSLSIVEPESEVQKSKVKAKRTWADPIFGITNFY